MSALDPRKPIAYAVAVACIAALLIYVVPTLDLTDLNFPDIQTLDIDYLQSLITPPPKEVDWADRKEHYPVKEYIPIPDPTRKTIPRIQHQFKPQTQSEASTRQQRQKVVRLTIERAWRSYKKHGFPQDELRSISGTAHDIYGNWSLTLVESLDTLWLAGLEYEYKEAVELMPAINFNVITNQERINVDEVSSRFLGGLISTYELSGDRRLKDKANELANILYAAFDTQNRLPNDPWDMMGSKRGTRQKAPSSAAIADVGGLAVEFTRLAIITKDPKWYDAVARITNAIAEQQDSASYAGCEQRRFIESLPKTYALLRGSDQYKALAKTAMDSIITNLLFRPMVPPGDYTTDILLPGTLVNNTLTPEVHHSVCSLAGTLAYTSRLLRNDTYLTTARQLLHGCLWASQTTPLGIMPEVFTVVPCPVQDKPCPWDEDLYTSTLLTALSSPPTTDPKVLTWKHRLPQGLTSISSRHYTLHSSLITSLFTLYRITGDEDLQEQAWKLWTSMYGRSKTKFAHAVIEDVTQPAAPKLDLMPSEWMGATLKGFLLMFGEDREGSLDEWVLSSGGHLMGLGRGDLEV